MAILKDLIVHGSSRFLNKIYASELETPLISADAGVFKKLTAKDLTAETATVIGLLDVQGQLHTNTWTNSNIATIDGCFYITPTLSSDTGNIVFSSTSTASLAGTYTAVTSLYIGDATSGSTVQWTAGSNVLLTGQVKVNNEWIPLGTLLGTLSGNATTSAIGLSGLTDNRHNTSSIVTDIRNIVGSTSVEYRNLKISLYQRKDGNDSKPLGIYMTAMGANGKTFIDIYGGVNSTTTAGSSGGFADPNLRIGNLSGLGAVEGTTPTGWGIYTTNGYFKGVIVSSAGKIGNFTINSALYSNNHSAWNSNVSGIYINNDGISGGAGGKWWLWNDGSAKIGEMTLSAAGVLTVPAANVSGKLTAATIDGTQITANTITADQIATGAIKTDELDANAVTSAKIKAGEVKATNIASSAVTADKLDATTINASNKLTVGALTTTDQNNILNSNIQIGGTNLLKNSNDLTKWSKESGLTVIWDSTVNMYKVVDTSHTSSKWGIYQDLDIKPNTTYTFSIWGMKSEDTSTSSAVGTFASSLSWPGTNSSTYTTTMSRSSVTFTSGTDHVKCRVYLYLNPTANSSKTGYFYRPKLEEGNKVTDWSPAPEDIDVHQYITDIDSNKGITIKPADASGNDYLQMNSSAINFYRNNVETLKIEDSAIRVGKLGNSLRNVYITDSVVQIRNNTSVLAEYGDSIKLYKPTTTTAAVEISSSGASFTGNIIAASLSTGTKTASTTGKGTYIDGSGNIYVGNGSTNNFTVTDTGTITATGANLLTATIGNATNKISIGTGTSGHSSIRYGMTILADTTNNGFYIGTDGIALGKGAFKVTAAGAFTATSGSISGGIVTSGIDAGNITVGTLAAERIDASSLSIGISQVTNLQTTLNGKQASGDYATNTALSNVSTVANTALGQSIWYAECQTAAATAVKVATISPATTSFPNPLVNGTTVNVKFTNTNSATNTSLKLNVNNTGEKSIKYIYNGAITDIVKDYLKANQMYQFRYDGTYWIVQMMRNTNDNNVDRSLYAVALAASAAISAGRIAVLGTDNKLHTLDSTAFDISCPPLYVATAYTAANATSATTRTTNYSYWGTAFNLTSTHSIANAVANSNVYIVGTLSGDIFTPTTTVLTCSEPTTEDGLYYMLLGRMSTTANAVLQAEHPIYVFKNGAFQKLESTTATSYITYIDANDGIKVHNADDKTDYIQINSTAVSMYRNNKKMLSLGDSSLQFYKNDDATNSIAEFGATVRIGKSNAANFTIESTKMSGLGSAGRTYFETGDASQTSTQAFEGDGETTNFNLQKTNSIQQVTIDGSVLASSNYSLVTTDGINQIHFNTAPAEDAVIVVTYQATQQNPYFIFGTRKTSTTLGLGSVSLGRDLEASAPYSYAEGYANFATGLSSHAEGYNCGAIASYAHAGGFNSYATRDSAFAHGYYVISRGKGGLACGQYNVPDGRYMLCVGVGDSESTRANAFMVTKMGSVIMSGRFFSGTSANTGDYRTMFTKDTVTMNSLAVPAQNGKVNQKITASKTGYTPYGILGYQITGTNANPCSLSYFTINSSEEVVFNIYNSSTTQSTVKIVFEIYYIATAAL